MNKAVFKSYNIDAKVICEKCSSGGTFTIGFYDMKLTGRGSDIQKLLLNQSKRKSSTVLWIGLGSPMNFIEVMSQFF